MANGHECKAGKDLEGVIQT